MTEKDTDNPSQGQSVKLPVCGCKKAVLLYFYLIFAAMHRLIFSALMEIEKFRLLHTMMLYNLVFGHKHFSGLQMRILMAAQIAANIRFHKFTSKCTVQSSSRVQCYTSTIYVVFIYYLFSVSVFIHFCFFLHFLSSHLMLSILLFISFSFYHNKLNFFCITICILYKLTGHCMRYTCKI